MGTQDEALWSQTPCLHLPKLPAGEVVFESWWDISQSFRESLLDCKPCSDSWVFQLPAEYFGLRTMLQLVIRSKPTGTTNLASSIQ